MPRFPTPEPISVVVELVGDVRITASDRDDTVVTVRPRDPSNASDVKTAEQTNVELLAGQLTIKAPRNWRRFTPFGGTETIEVILELPTGSQVTADSAFGSFSADGELGECRLKSAMGNIRLDHTGPLNVSTGYGNITVDRAGGPTELRTGTGAIRIDEIDGPATIKNANGDTDIGEVTGDLRVKASNGDVTVRRAQDSATARTACGDVRFLDVQRGTVVLETAAGELEVGIREGTAAWFDVETKFGMVRSSLDPTEEPGPSDTTAEVRARTSAGDILIGRAQPTTRSDQGSDQ